MDGRPRRRLWALGGLALAGCMLLGAQAGTARAEQVRFHFDDGRVNIGQFKGERVVDEAGPLATLFASFDTATGEFNAPPSGLFVPARTFEDVDTGAGTYDVVIGFAAIAPISGNFNQASGVLDTRALDVRAEISIYQAGSPGQDAALLARCAVSPIPVPLDSTGSLVDDSDPVNPVTHSGDPFDIEGAAVATWDSLPPSTPAGGPLASFACPFADEMASGPGGIWLAGLADITADPPSIDPPSVPAVPHAKQRKRCKQGKRPRKGRCVKRKPR